MRTHRLNRLALLTQGVALVGLGISQLACGKDAAPPPEQPHINSPPERPPVPAAVDAAPEPAASTAPAAPSASASSSAGVAAMPTNPIRVNAPPKKLPPPPKP